MQYKVATELADKPSFVGARTVMRGAEIYPDSSLGVERGKSTPPLSEKHITEIFTGKQKYFFYGLIIYKDIFGNTFERAFARVVQVKSPEEGKYSFRVIFPDNDDVEKAAKWNYLKARAPGDVDVRTIDFAFALNEFSVKKGCGIQFAITNTDETDIVIDEIYFTYRYRKELPDDPQYVGRNQITGVNTFPCTIGPNLSLTATPQHLAISKPIFQEILGGTRFGFVYGKVIFRKASGDRFEAGFVRRIRLTDFTKNENGKTAVVFGIDTPVGYPHYDFERKLAQP